MSATSQTLGMLVLLLAGASSPAGAGYLNTTTGGPLRPGVYGRIEIGKAAPPPLIFKRPVVGSNSLVRAGVKPVYLYVPPGQVRKWSRYCGKYRACNLPVYFVRMDNSPSRLGKWKKRSEFAQRRDADAALRTMGGPPGYRN